MEIYRLNLTKIVMIFFSIIITETAALFESCTYAIERMNYGPAEFDQIIKTGQKYEDDSFNGR